MTVRALPPVRRRVPWARIAPEVGRERTRAFFAGREVVLFGSGTQALAAAMTECRLRRAVERPEVLLPAYGCPDLVSACLGAGVRPRLVDTAPDVWGYDTQALRESLSVRTVAVVAVNLLGAGDDAPRLSSIARAAGVTLIQDSAQHLSRDGGAGLGDYTVFSFGRGKPLNLLGGGALVAGAPLMQEIPPEGRSVKAALRSGRFAGAMFNMLTRPVLFAWVSRLPGMGLGETRYKPPPPLAGLPFSAWGRVGAALEDYRRAPSYSACVWSEALETWSARGIVRLQGVDPTAEEEPLRLPLLAPDRNTRDRLVAALQRRGLGASPMYGKALAQLPDVPPEVSAQGPFPNARRLADRLFTLPTHTVVTARDVDVADAVVRSLLEVMPGG